MDRISELPDAQLLSILSLMPTRDAVATMVLSKRWQFLWTLVPRLEYSDDMYQHGKKGRFLRFVYSSLLLYESQVLESLSLKLSKKSDAIDIGICVKAAASRCVRELNIEIDTVETPVILPRSLYTSCRMLVKLVLNNAVLVNSPAPISFPSLKTLELLSIKYPSDEFFCKLLSSCPVLEDLYVEQCLGDNVPTLVVRVASLKVLCVDLQPLSEDDNHQGIRIDAPSLEDLDIVDNSDGYCVLECNMPRVVKASLDVSYSHTEKLLGSLSSVEKLELCFVTSKNAYFEGTIFSRLEFLALCTWDTEWLDLLMRLLKDSPKLRFLQLEQLHETKTEKPRPSWNEPSHVPECLLSSLKTFEWRGYEGREEEKEVATFILRNSCHLEIARFYPKSTDPVENLQMLMELSMSPRSSSICKLLYSMGITIQAQSEMTNFIG